MFQDIIRVQLYTKEFKLPPDHFLLLHYGSDHDHRLITAGVFDRRIYSTSP